VLKNGLRLLLDWPEGMLGGRSLQGRCDLLSYVTLHLKHVGQLAVILVCPKVYVTA